MIHKDFIKDPHLLIRRLTLLALSLDSTIETLNYDILDKKLTELYGDKTNYSVSEKTLQRDILYIEKVFNLKFEKAGKTRDRRFVNLPDDNNLSLAIKLFATLTMESKEIDNSFELLAKSKNKLILLNMMKINAGINNRQNIIIKYRMKYYPEKTFDIEVEPYEIVFNYGRLYLIGYSTYEKTQGFKQYIFENIEKVDFVKKNGEPVYFNRDKNFSLSDFYSYSLKSFRQEQNRTEFEVWFAKEILQDIEIIYNLKEVKIEKQDDDSIIATFNVDGTQELIDWIWQFGSYAQILSPKEAIKEIKDRIKELKKLY